MTHDFSYNPIKLRIVNIKTGEWKRSYVFCGSVPKDIEKELVKLEKIYNIKQVIYKSNKLSKFYGKNWQYRLGIIDHSKQAKLIKHGGDELNGNDSMIQSIIGGMVPEYDNDKKSEFEIPDDVDISTMNLKEFDIGDEILDDIIPKTSVIDITDEELRQVDDKELVTEENDIVNNILEDREHVEKIEKVGDVKFIFDIKVYPSDNILTFKQKLYLVTDIPIYRQHLWFKYKNKAYPAHYNISIFKNDINVDIETLIAFYNGEKKMNEIEGIPVELSNYRNKEFMVIDAQDTFHLLYTNFYKYGVDEYYLVDAGDLINPNIIYNKLRKDRYQLEVIYYGFIVIYFPMITYNVFMDYIKNSKSIADIYPELQHNKNYLKKKFNINAMIMDEAYEAQDDSKHISKNLFSSITNTVISIDNYKQNTDVLLVLRNIFDTLKLTNTITYCKTNLIFETQNIMLKKSYFNEPEPTEPIPVNSIMIKIKINPDTNEYMKLIMFKNGNYIIKTKWREENHMDFKKITKTVIDKINPIIKMINKMGNMVKYYDIEIPYITTNNIQFTETGFVFYYDDDMTEAKFKIFKNILEDMAMSDILITNENVVLGQDYFFRTGMYKFDSSRIEKSISLTNYYDHLSNGIVKQKWNTIFERTRLFQVINISSKLKMSISGIRNDNEIYFFNLILIGILHIFVRNSKDIKNNISEIVYNKSKKQLKNLKLQDPLLYDFKKIYKSNVIYSKICQKPYQPLMLNDNEYKNMSKDKRSRAVKYWNFTTEKPVWYSCPNPKFQYIKFIIKQHPKDYCIPCCKKIEMNENVNQTKQNIHKLCLKTHKFTGEKLSLTKGSHYIATYGKDIEVGRLSRLPEHTLEPLFFDLYSPEDGIDSECTTADGYYLLGIDQNTSNIQNIGYMYCLLHSLNMNVDDFLINCVKKLKNDPSKFRVLLDGNAGLYFEDHYEMMDVISMLNLDTLLDTKFEIIPWNNLFMSIGYYFYGVNPVLFSDKNKESIDMILPNELKTVDEMFPSTHKNLVILQKKMKYYPIYLINTEIFKRTGIISTRLFLNESGLMTTIHAIVRRHFEGSDHEKIKTCINLPILKDFTKTHNTIKLLSYFINYANLCYAVLFEFRKKLCYFPINASHYSLDRDIKLIFEPFNNKYYTEISTLLDLYDVYNKWVLLESKKAGMIDVEIYPLIKVDNWLFNKDSKQVIGFINNNVHYYCKPLSESSALKYRKSPVQHILYDPNKINKLIHSVKSGKKKLTTNEVVHKKIQQSKYQYHIYELVILQLNDVFNKHRNTNLRQKFLTILAKTNFDKTMKPLRQFIDKEILDNEDSNKIKNIISKYLNVHHKKSQMIKDIKDTYFNFDKILLEKLKYLPYEEVLTQLHIISKSFVKFGDISNKNFIFPNIILSCNNIKKNNSYQYCVNNKLLIQKKQLDKILNIIAYDIINPYKWKWLFNSAFIEKSVNFFKFIRHSSETIKVVFL
jgi:hypothetical protein